MRRVQWAITTSTHPSQTVKGQPVAFRADAVFARSAIYEALETRGVPYAIRIRANKNLALAIEDVLCRSPGRPGLKPLVRYKGFHYTPCEVLLAPAGGQSPGAAAVRVEIVTAARSRRQRMSTGPQAY
jgi:hypothetical protein